MDRHGSNARAVAEYLSGHAGVSEVHYPGLESHPQHDLARRQMTGFGGMVTFIPDGGQDEANRIVAATRVFRLAESLGGVESLIEVPAAMTHLSVQGTELEVPPDMIRLSVGLEHVDDLIEDLDQAMRLLARRKSEDGRESGIGVSARLQHRIELRGEAPANRGPRIGTLSTFTRDARPRSDSSRVSESRWSGLESPPVPHWWERRLEWRRR